MNFESSLSTQESSNPAEATLETGKKAFEFLRRTGFLEMRKSDEQFNEWLKNLSYEEYSDYLTRMNGIVRETPIHERSVDGEHVEISFGVSNDTGYLPPSGEQKERYMRETFEAIQDIESNDDRALLSYYALQAIHPYSDGNGRTGRLIHELLSEDGKTLTEEGLAELLDHDAKGHGASGKGRDTFSEKILPPREAYYYINREIAKDIIGEDFFKEYGAIYISAATGAAYVPERLSTALTNEEMETLRKVVGEGDTPNVSFRGLVLMQFLKERGQASQYRFEIKRVLKEGERDGAVAPEDVGKKLLGIEYEEIVESLTPEDARRLIKIHEEIKGKFLATMIDIFAHPSNHQLATKTGTHIPVKEVFNKTI